MERGILIEFSDKGNIYLKLSKATAVKTTKEMIHLDKLDDGTWRLIYNENLIEDFSKVKTLQVIREHQLLKNKSEYEEFTYYLKDDKTVLHGLYKYDNGKLKVEYYYWEGKKYKSKEAYEESKITNKDW